MSFSSGSGESERYRWVHFGGVARLLMNYHVLLFMSVVVTSQCLNVVYIVVSNCLLSRTTGGLNCRCQNWRISGRGSRTVRLRRMVTGGRGHDVYPGSGPLDGGNTLRPA